MDRETWRRVQEKLVARRDRHTPRRSRNLDRYLLSGLVYCGHCGRKMHGAIETRKKQGRVYRWEKFVCFTYQQGGKVHGCLYHTVDQKERVPFLLGKLREIVLVGGHRERLREKIVESLRKRRNADPSYAKGLRDKLADLDRQIRQGAERLLKSPEDITDLLAPQPSAWRNERERLADELATAERTTGPVDLDTEADAAVDRLRALRR